MGIMQSGPTAGPSRRTTETDLRNTGIFLVALALGGVFSVAMWSYIQTGGFGPFAFGLLLMGGTALAGGVLGLLFGIPKSVSDPSSSAPPADPRTNGDIARRGDFGRSNFTTNTNLEQISDWLTKIIVGVGLTELPAIRDQFVRFSKYFSSGLIRPVGAASLTDGTAVSAVIIIYGFSGGFLAGYLLTRIFLTGAFERVADALRRENEELHVKNSALASEVAEVKESAERIGEHLGEIYSDLYKDTEEAALDAISKIEELFKVETHRKNPALWTYLAAAHGQAYVWAQKNIAPGPEKLAKLFEHRNTALKAVKAALEQGDAWKPTLQLLWDKNHPVKLSANGAKDENDLEIFYDDEDFKKLLSS